MTYLVDTVVLSELRKRARNHNVVSWIGAVRPDELYLSTISVAEIEIGIERQRSVNPDFASALASWLEVTIRAYGDRILPLDVPVARRWGRLAARIGNTGLDLAIAATALEHGLTVVTRNESDFSPTGVAIVNPFNPRPRRGR